MHKPSSTTPAIATGNLYRFRLDCAFEFSHTFAASGIQPEGGDEMDFEPTEDGLAALAEAMIGSLDYADFAVHSFDIDAETEEILGGLPSVETNSFGGHNFNIFCSCKLDVFLDASKVEFDTSKRIKGHIRPTDAALEEVGHGLALALDNWPVGDVEVDTKSENLRRCVNLVIPRHLYRALEVRAKNTDALIRPDIPDSAIAARAKPIRASITAAKKTDKRTEEMPSTRLKSRRKTPGTGEI